MLCYYVFSLLLPKNEYPLSKEGMQEKVSIMAVWILNVRIYHEYEGGIEKPVPRDYRMASRGLPSDDNK